MLCHTMFIVLGLCLSMIQTSSAHKFNKHVELKTVKKDKKINQASLSSLKSLLGKANVKDFVRDNFSSKMTKSNFKEVSESESESESEKKYTNKLSFLLSDIQILYTELSDEVLGNDIRPGGLQETLYMNTPVVDKYNKLAGEIDLSAHCQLRNLTIPSPLQLLGDGVYGACQVSFTFTAKDSVKSSVTFAVAVTSTSVANLFESFIINGFVNKEFRSVSADGVYLGKTFEVKAGVKPLTNPTDFLVSFYVTEKKSEKSSQLDGRALSSKYYPPVIFALDTSKSVEEAWIKSGIPIGFSPGGADQVHSNYPFYENGKFVGILLITAHSNDFGLNRRLKKEKLLSQSDESYLEQVIYTYVLNDAQASSISFIIGLPSSSVSVYRQLSFAANGVFSGKVFDITLTFSAGDDVSEYITFTEVKNSKSLSYSGVAEEIEGSRALKKGDDDYKQIVVTDPPFSVSFNTPPDAYQIFGFPGWDIKNPPIGTFPDLWYPPIESSRQGTFYTAMVITNQITWEVMGYIAGVHACQPTFGGTGTSFTCQSTITYVANDLLDSSITFVTSLTRKDLAFVDTDKVVPSLSASGAFFGKTYNVRLIVLEGLKSVDLTFTEVRNGQVVTYKPTKQPVFKPTKKPIYSKKSNDKKSNSKQTSGTVDSSSTGSPSIGAIVGITVGAFLLIGLLIGAYFWYMKKLQLKNSPVSLEENM